MAVAITAGNSFVFDESLTHGGPSQINKFLAKVAMAFRWLNMGFGESFRVFVAEVAIVMHWIAGFP